MGQDVSFNRKAAEQAGVLYKTDTNGTVEDIAEEASKLRSCDGEYDGGSANYLRWLEEEMELLSVNGGESWAHTSTIDGDSFVRANCWGSLFAPLTQLLEENDITWRTS